VHYPYTLVVGPVVALLVVDVWTNEKRPAECWCMCCKSEQMVDEIWKNVQMEGDADGEWWGVIACIV
jgi:hypothetical protein